MHKPNKEMIFWLDEFNGKAKGGFFYRSKIAIEIDDIQTRFGLKVVGIRLEEEGNEPSWNVEFITEAQDDEEDS
tara:strand:- start:262 stop:483 length:222 start_codon:yes stop_codon:yes gene_type:complete